MTEDEVLPSTEKVLYEVEDHLARITINRPEKMNAMDPETYQALSEAWVRVRDDADVWAALVTGAGTDAFSAGADLESSIRPGDTDWAEFWKTQDQMLLNRGMEIWKPVISAVNGYCLAGGMTLLLATDIRIASEDATFNLAEVKRGILPANGGTQRAMQQLPRPIAMEFLLTGDSIDSREAERWGLVNEVVPGDEVVETAEAYAERIVSNAPLAVQAIKELGVRSRDASLSEGSRLEESFARHLLQTEDAEEGVRAFAEDREPQFKGR